MAQTEWQRRQHKSHVQINHVIGDDQHWPVHAAQIFAPENARVRQQVCRGPGQQVIEECADPCNRPALRPARKHEFRPNGRRRPHHRFQFTDRSGRSDPRFIQVHLIAVFQRTQELHAIERTSSAGRFPDLSWSQLCRRWSPRIRAMSSPIPPVVAGQFAAPSPLSPLRFDRSANFGELRFAGGRARKISLRPQKPGAHPLIFRQGFIHARDNSRRMARLLDPSSHRAAAKRRTAPRFPRARVRSPRSPLLPVPAAIELPGLPGKHSFRQQ